MSSAIFRMSLGLMAWGGCLAGALAFANWPGDLGHGICGPWGCGPPLQALIACHAAWLVALAPPAGLLVGSRNVSVTTRMRVGIAMTLLPMAVLTCLFAHQLLVWWPQVSQWQRPYFWQRYGFTIATTIDVPVVQVLLIGLAIWLSEHSRRRIAGCLAIGGSTAGPDAGAALPGNGRADSPKMLWTSTHGGTSDAGADKESRPANRD